MDFVVCVSSWKVVKMLVLDVLEKHLLEVIYSWKWCWISLVFFLSKDKNKGKV